MDEMVFLVPVRVGDVVHFSGQVNWTGRSSMEVGVRITADRWDSVGPQVHVASAYLVFVAVDADGTAAGGAAGRSGDRTRIAVGCARPRSGAATGSPAARPSSPPARKTPARKTRVSKQAPRGGRRSEGVREDGPRAQVHEQWKAPAGGRRRAWVSLFGSARRHPSAVLLLVQLLGVLVYPAMEGSRGGRVAFEILGIVVLVLAVFSVRATPGLTWVSIGLGIPAVVLSLVDAFNPTEPVVAISGVLHAAFYFYAAYSLLRYMLSDHDVSTDELYATGATFTLVAWGFAYLYVFVQVLVPGSFTAAVNPTGRPHLDGAAVPELHHAVQHGPERHRPHHVVGQVGGDARAAGRSRVRRHGRVPPGRPDHHQT